MKTSRLLTLVSCCLLPILLSSCAQYYIQTGQLDSQLADWETTHQYQTAIDSINQLPKDHPNYAKYQKQQKVLLKDQQRYIHNTIKQANKLISKRQFHEALSLYRQAIDNNPEQPHLQQGYDNSRLQLLIYSTKLQHQLNLVDARVLRQQLRLMTELQRSNPDRPSYQQQLATLQARQLELYAFLTDCAEDGLQFTNFSHGTECLKLARQLLPERTQDDMLVVLEQRYQQRHKESLSVRERKTQQQISALEQQYQQALQQQDYLRASALLEQQEQLLPGNSYLVSTRLELQTDIDRYLEQQMKLGADAYSDGKITKALEIWRPLLPLSPDNLTLQGQIQRAESFTNKLKSLKKEP